MDNDLQKALDTLTGETKTIFGDLTGKYDALKTKTAEMQTQLDAVDKLAQGRHGGFSGDHSKSLADHLKASDSVNRLLLDRKGVARITLSGADAAEILERKTTITSGVVGAQTAGVLPLGRIPGIVQEARQRLTIRDVLTANPTTFGYLEFLKVVNPATIASPQVETAAKAENAVTFAAVSERVKTLATWIPTSKQVLDDMGELAAFLEQTLSYYVGLAEELQLLAGDGTGENLHGLLPQAAAFNTSLLSPASGWTKIDVIGRAIEQQGIARELNPTFIVLNPRDWTDMRLLKNSLGEYILGPPQTNVSASLFNRAVVETNSMAAGTFLVGSGDSAAAEIRDRQELMYEISTEHADFYVRNMIACRAERRLALLVKRPNAFLTGSFTSSPA